MHLQGSRPDISTDRLVQAPHSFLPSSNYELLRISVEPILWAAKAADYLPDWLPDWLPNWSSSQLPLDPDKEIALANMLHERTLFFDKALIAAL